MNDLFWLYLLTRLDAFKMFWMAGAVVFGVIAIFSLICCLDSCDDEETAKNVSRAKKALAVAFTTLGICVLIPSTSSAMFILGGATVLDAARSEPARRIAGKSVEFIERFLDEQLKKSKEGKE
jgi:hypothetical protein